jgi:hypothetical protein
MMPQPSNEEAAYEMPDDVADAWAEVYINVAEKLNANEQGRDSVSNDKPRNTLTHEVSLCTSTSPAKPTQNQQIHCFRAQGV